MEEEKQNIQDEFDELLQNNADLEKQLITMKEEIETMKKDQAESTNIKSDYEYAKYQIEELQNELKQVQRQNEKFDDDLQTT